VTEVVTEIPDNVQRALNLMCEVLEDERHHYDKANVRVNAPLALIQTEKQSQLTTALQIVQTWLDSTALDRLEWSYEHPENGESHFEVTEDGFTESRDAR